MVPSKPCKRGLAAVMKTLSTPFRPASRMAGVPFTTFCIWRRYSDEAWQRGAVEFPAGGRRPRRLRVLTGGAVTAPGSARPASASARCRYRAGRHRAGRRAAGVSDGCGGRTALYRQRHGDGSGPGGARPESAPASVSVRRRRPGGAESARGRNRRRRRCQCGTGGRAARGRRRQYGAGSSTSCQPPFAGITN